MQQGEWFPEASSAFEHFMQRGWKINLDPNRWFSTSAYLRDNPDVAAAEVNPFMHFLSTGSREGRTPKSYLSKDTDDGMGGW